MAHPRDGRRDQLRHERRLVAQTHPHRPGLARRWDELNDDMILAAGRTDGDAHAQAVPAAVPEPDAAPWLPDWAVETLAELDGQDATAGGEATA